MTATGQEIPPRIDTRGLRCPWPVLRAARAMRSDQSFTLLADDPVALVDIPVLATERGWKMIVSQEESYFIFDFIMTD